MEIKIGYREFVSNKVEDARWEQVMFQTTNGFLCLVDHEDWLRIKEYKWRYQPNRGRYGCVINIETLQNLNVFITDRRLNFHINNNPLDFRRENISDSALDVVK